jgi:hypothetical protein
MCHMSISSRFTPDLCSVFDYNLRG